jgi:glyoxylase-like metal-dependent hydrolase (beta-lactamase superfamily II)
MRKFHASLVLAAVAAFCVGLGAQPPAGKGKGAPKAGATVEKIRELKPNLYLIVDTKLQGDDNHNRMMEEIRSVSMAPVKYVVNTQHHPDHVGTNQKFIDAGAQVVALKALADFMASDPRTKDIPGRPSKTFAKDETLKLGGASVELHFYGPGHTGDDTMVYFPAEKVVMVSDQMSDTTPVVDFANGGSAVNWNKSLDGVLALDFEWAIPGRGEPKTKAEVKAFRDKWDSMLKDATLAIQGGATKETLATNVTTPGWMFQAAFWGSLYDELKK